MFSVINTFLLVLTALPVKKFITCTECQYGNVCSCCPDRITEIFSSFVSVPFKNFHMFLNVDVL